MNPYKILAILAIASAAMFGYCSAGGDSAGSCKFAGRCTDWIGADYTQDSQKGNCEGEYSTDACTSSGKTGVCIVNEGQANEYKLTFYAPEFPTKNDADANCDTAGGRIIE